MSGVTWERTASFVNTGNTNLITYGEALLKETNATYSSSVTANTGTSTKYVSIYPNSSTSITLDTASQENYAGNTKIYGDAVRETSSSIAGTSNTGWNTSSWNSDYSCFTGYTSPFFARGGSCTDAYHAGAFAFYRTNGSSFCVHGFRAVLVTK